MARLSEVFGNISAPPQLDAYNADITKGGLTSLLSNIIRLITIVGGLWAFFNLLLAGFTYITSGDKPDEIKHAHERIYMSLIGLVVLVGAFIIAGIIGYLLYGRADALINPVIYGPRP